MKNILFLSTGGTIASTASENGLIPTAGSEALLRLIPELQALCHIQFRELFSLDSSNIQPEDWVLMANTVYEALNSEKYDGIVITHGTDTMAYSAAALSFMLQNLKKPVILTGSQLPIEAPGTDGKRNILNAFLAASDERLSGVYLVFDGLIIDGFCAKKVYSRSLHAFESINRPPAGQIRDGKVILNQKPEQKSSRPLTLNTALDENVLLIKLIPGMKNELLDAAPSLGYKAVVIEAFGTGGIPNLRKSLLPSIRSLTDKKIPVVITTQCIYDGCDLSIYEVGSGASKAGAVCAGDMTTEAAVVKLMWILGQTADFNQIIQLFTTDFFGESTKNQSFCLF